MKKQLLTLLFLSTTFFVTAQNLVPNGDFEQYAFCPQNQSLIHFAIPWINPSTGGSNGSPDYFNQCCTTSQVDVPNNIRGWQYAHSGVAYSGIFLFTMPPNFSSNYREYIEIPLASSLTANACYHFEMYVSLGDESAYTTNDIGIYFSDTAVTGINNFLPLPFIPQINNTIGNIFDTLNWALVTGNYMASGGEQHLIIGNFKNDINTNIIFNNGGDERSYVYIDDVCLTSCGSSCFTGIEEHNQQNEITIYPNPAEDYFELRISNFGLNKKYELKIYDVMGKEVLQSAINLQSTIINIKSLQSGIYFIEINGVRKKFVKQ